MLKKIFLLFFILLSFLLAIVLLRKYYYTNNCFKNCELIKINSTYDNITQYCYYYISKKYQVPLLVSLHTWGGTYAQEDSLIYFAEENNWNYIHPDYRGVHWNKNSCCFEPAIIDIDDAIDYAVSKGNVDTSNIFIVGKSGGGTAAIACFLKSKYRNLKCFAWAPITDYVSWYNEVRADSILKQKYLKKILIGLGSDTVFNKSQAELKSPYYFTINSEIEYKNSSLYIYTGIMDGITGSTSIMQPINFYNKLLSEWGVNDTTNYITDFEKSFLFSNRKNIFSYYELIHDRKIIHNKSYNNVQIILFDGSHEIIYPYVFKELLLYGK